MTAQTLEIAGEKLKLTNLDKVLYPAAGFKKSDIIDYYMRISPAILPHLADRPITLKRYPEGVQRPFFYEKRCPPHRPQWVQTFDPAAAPGQPSYCLINDLPSLVWVANLASIELHTMLWRKTGPSIPTWMVFDLDPGPGVDIAECCRIALILRDMLHGLGLESFIKTSGLKGLHLYVPLNCELPPDSPKRFARAVATAMEKYFPSRIVARMGKSLRPGKVFIDYSQNDIHKTTVCAWSLRAGPSPTVSMPLEWSDVEEAQAGHNLQFTPERAAEAFSARGDPFARALSMTQQLPPKASRLSGTD